MLAWKKREDRKPLVLKGVRQVGKTWLMLEFGKKYYTNYVYFNLCEDDKLKPIFENNKNPEEIVEHLSLIGGKKILPEKTLIIFDEIHDCPEAFRALQYFGEKAREYHVVAAGSLLGAMLTQPEFYPNDMVDILEIKPYYFDEYLEATDESLYSYYLGIEKDKPIEETLHSRLLEAYNLYLIIGGMPECVNSWISYRDLKKVAQIQQDIIADYENTFSIYNESLESGRILMTFRCIPSQLAKPNERFKYGAIEEGGRVWDFEKAIEWLLSLDILNRVYNITNIEYPLSEFVMTDYFKVFMFDTGILKQMAGIDNSDILFKDDFKFKGQLTENYMLQQLKGQFDADPHYFSTLGGEIDFVLQHGTEIILVDVKSGEDKPSPYFEWYVNAAKPEYAIRFSKNNYQKNGRIINIPLYLVRKTKNSYKIHR